MNEDPKLRQILGTWQVSPPPAPDFKSSVWRRISAEEARRPSGLWAPLRDWLFVQLPKPAYASALVALAVVVGMTTANLHASHMRDQYRLNYARQYLASIDAVAMNAPRSPAAR